MSGTTSIRRCFLGILVVAILALPAAALAEAAGEHADPSAPAAVKADDGKKFRLGGLHAIGAALAIGLTALATGFAQAKIGSAGMGAIAENPKQLGTVIMLIAIPETVAILGFVVAYLIISS